MEALFLIAIVLPFAALAFCLSRRTVVEDEEPTLDVENHIGDTETRP